MDNHPSMTGMTKECDWKAYIDKIKIMLAPDPTRIVDPEKPPKAVQELEQLILSGTLKRTIGAILDPPAPDEPPESTNCHMVAISLMADLLMYPKRDNPIWHGWKMVSGYKYKSDGARWEHSWLERGFYAVDASGVITFPEMEEGLLYILVVDKWAYRKEIGVKVTRELNYSAFLRLIHVR